MAARLLVVTVLTCGIAFSVIGMANASSSTVSKVSPVAVTHAPEIDPTGLGSGIAMLLGGMMLIGERRRWRK